VTDALDQRVPVLAYDPTLATDACAYLVTFVSGFGWHDVHAARPV